MSNKLVGLYIGAKVLAMAAGLAYLGDSDAAERGTPTPGVAYDLIRSGQFVQRGLPSAQACDEALAAKRALYAATKTSGSERWICREDRWVNVSYGPNPVTCAAAPSPRQQTCLDGYSGSWTQTATVGPAPACVVTWTPSTMPPGSCTPIQPNGTATLNWQHDGRNVEGFRIVYGTSPTALSQTVQFPDPAIRTVIIPLQPGTYFFGVKAYQGGNESDVSNVVSKVIVQ